MKTYKFSIVLIFFLVSQLISGQILNKDTNYLKQQKEFFQMDSLIFKIQKLQTQDTLLINESKYQSSRLDKIFENLENRKFNYFSDFISPILLSVIAAIIFWATFSFFPERARRLKIRPKLEFDIFNVYNNLFAIFDLVMTGNSHSPSYFQQKIRGNKLIRDEIELGLQNKCLNETYLYDTNVNRFMIATGESLFDRASKIDLTVERLFSFSTYLTTEEILLLEKIRNKLQTYDLNDFNRSAIAKIGGMELKPINSSLAYMTQNLFELYELFNQLQEFVFHNNYSDRNISVSKVQHYYYSQQYDKCRIESKKTIKRYPKDKEFLEFYLFLSEYMSGKKEDAYIKLDEILKEKPHLVSNRSFLKDVVQDKKIIEMIKKNYSEGEILEFHNVIKNEDRSHENFIAQAKGILKYFKERSDDNRAKNKTL